MAAISDQNQADALLKKDKIKKTEIVKEIHQLKVKIHALEREKASHVYNKRGDFYKEFAMLQETEEKMNMARNTESM